LDFPIYQRGLSLRRGTRVGNRGFVSYGGRTHVCAWRVQSDHAWQGQGNDGGRGDGVAVVAWLVHDFEFDQSEFGSPETDYGGGEQGGEDYECEVLL